jgi:2-polyprenyl-3-methyl-5-hydroxy-6-metoxy-1,4-benzoquinol methylase
MQNKDHWYDGLFYDLVIAPNQDTSFELIEQMIMPGSSILDVGCGTGRFALKLKKKYSKIDGVDLSKRNIEIAEKRRSKNNNTKIAFYHEDIVQFLRRTGNSYDYAVLSYMIHETDQDKVKDILHNVASHADEIIISDYLVPHSGGIWSSINEVIEFIAGRDHYRNFKSYVNNGGIAGLAVKNNLKIVRELRDDPSTNHIAILKKERK